MHWFSGPKITDWQERTPEFGLGVVTFSDAETGYQYRAEKRLTGGFNLFRTSRNPGKLPPGDPEHLCAVPGEASPEIVAVAIHVFDVGSRTGQAQGEARAKAEIRRALGVS